MSKLKIMVKLNESFMITRFSFDIPTQSLEEVEWKQGDKCQLIEPVGKKFLLYNTRLDDVGVVEGHLFNDEIGE